MTAPLSVPPSPVVMTDFALAQELLATVQWILQMHSTESAQLHVDRIARAVSFLHGERSHPSVDDVTLQRLRRNDPFVAAIFELAEHSAIARLRRGDTAVRLDPLVDSITGVGVALDPLMPPGELRMFDGPRLVGRMTNLETDTNAGPSGADG